MDIYPIMTVIETVRLFKGIITQPVTRIVAKKDKTELFQNTINFGFIYSDPIISGYSHQELLDMAPVISKIIGISGEEMNSSFHKSWKKIIDSPIELLVIEQIMHYVTTAMGIDSPYVFIPPEVLDIPETDGLNLYVIRGYTIPEIREKIMNMIKSGIALSDEVMEDIISLITSLDLDINISEVKNKEVRVRLYDKLNITPSDPEEILRLIVYKCTGKSLLIKNKDTIEKIKQNSGIISPNLLENEELLARIFYRYKPIFLALRSNKNLRSQINRIRKLAVIHHKPMRPDYLNNVTNMVKHDTIDDKELISELLKINVFRKIRLLYAIKYRMLDTTSILYRVRNGKGYATDFSFDEKGKLNHIYDIVFQSIVDDVKPNVCGKKIYIPENVKYALPSTEKMFVGDFPSGTCITIPDDMIVGIHWYNVGGHRIDLDLSLIKIGNKIGWDSSYYNSKKDIIFSGDMTDARKPNGASELFYVKRSDPSSYVMLVNYYNHDEDITVPFSIVVANEILKDGIERNYMINPNKVISIPKTKINTKQKIIGILVRDEDKCSFYFTETAIGKTITSSDNEYTLKSKEFLINYYTNTITLDDIVKEAGGIITTEKEGCDIDLSPKMMEKDKIISILVKK